MLPVYEAVDVLIGVCVERQVTAVRRGAIFETFLPTFAVVFAGGAQSAGIDLAMGVGAPAEVGYAFQHGADDGLRVLQAEFGVVVETEVDVVVGAAAATRMGPPEKVVSHQAARHVERALTASGEQRRVDTGSYKPITETVGGLLDSVGQAPEAGAAHEDGGAGGVTH